MPPLSLTKIFTAIIGIIALFHLKDILGSIQAIYYWFGENLEGFNDFSDGARTAIAMSLILLAVVVIFEVTKRKE